MNSTLPNSDSGTSQPTIREHIAQLEKNAIEMANTLVQKGLISPEFAAKCLTHQERERKLNRPISFWEIIFIFAVPEIQPQTFLDAVSGTWINLQPMEILMTHGPITKALWMEAHAIREKILWARKIKTMEDICIERFGDEIGEQCKQVLSQYAPVSIDSFHNSAFRQREATKRWTGETLGLTKKPSTLQESLLVNNILQVSDISRVHQYMEEERRKGRVITFSGGVIELGTIKRRYLSDFMKKNGYSLSVEDILIDSDLVVESQVEQAKILQAELQAEWTEKPVEDILVEDMGVLSYEKLQETLAQQKHMTRTKPRMSEVDMGFFFLFEQEVLKKLGFVPYRIFPEYEPDVWTKKGKLRGYAIVVLSDDCTGDPAEKIRGEIDKKAPDIRRYMATTLWNTRMIANPKLDIDFEYAAWREMQSLIDRCFEQEKILNKMRPQGMSWWKEYMSDDSDIFHIGREYYSEKNENLNTFANILTTALDLRASDIHIEPRKNGGVAIRVRVDGMLHPIAELSHLTNENLIQSIKSSFKFKDGHVPNCPTDAHSSVFYSDKNLEVDVRFSSIPSKWLGDKIVARLAVQTDTFSTFEELWIPPNIAEKLTEILWFDRGIVMSTGPIWSGKTTLLRSAIGVLHDPSISIGTIEDPIEYRLPDDISQVEVGWPNWLTFAEALENYLRQDVNVVMVGEIRNPESAAATISASLTGQLILTTIHTNTAIEALGRLLDLGVRKHDLGSALLSIIGQRLARKICNECKEEYIPDPQHLRYVRQCFTDLDSYIKNKGVKFHRGTGIREEWNEKTQTYEKQKCTCCRGTGYLWRTAIVEMVCVNEELKQAVIDGKRTSEIEDIARRNGTTNLLEAGFCQVLTGLITIEELLRIAKTARLPRYRRTVAETWRLLYGTITREEFEKAIYGSSNYGLWDDAIIHDTLDTDALNKQGNGIILNQASTASVIEGLESVHSVLVVEEPWRKHH